MGSEKHDAEEVRRRSGEIFLDPEKIEDGGFGAASQYTPSIKDERSLGELREAILVRGRVGLAVMRSVCGELHISPDSPREESLGGRPAVSGSGPAGNVRGPLRRSD